jgi:hypothetical protein
METRRHPSLARPPPDAARARDQASLIPGGPRPIGPDDSREERIRTAIGETPKWSDVAMGIFVPARAAEVGCRRNERAGFILFPGKPTPA